MLGFLKRLWPEKGNSLIAPKKPQPSNRVERPKVLAFSPEQVQFYRYCKMANRGLDISSREKFKGLLKNLLADPSLIGLCKAEKTTKGYAGIAMPAGESGVPEYIDAVFFSRGGVYVCALSDASFVYDEKVRGKVQNSGENLQLAKQRAQTARDYVLEHFKFEPYALVARSPENSGLVIFQVFSAKEK